MLTEKDIERIERALNFDVARTDQEVASVLMTICSSHRELTARVAALQADKVRLRDALLRINNYSIEPQFIENLIYTIIANVLTETRD